MQLPKDEETTRSIYSQVIMCLFVGGGVVRWLINISPEVRFIYTAGNGYTYSNNLILGGGSFFGVRDSW